VNFTNLKESCVTPPDSEKPTFGEIWHYIPIIKDLNLTGIGKGKQLTV
jgi:hypothetical protein